MLLFGVARGKENSTLKEVVEEGSVSTEMGASFVSTVPMLCPHHCFRSWDMAAEVFVENEKEGCVEQELVAERQKSSKVVMVCDAVLDNF